MTCDFRIDNLFENLYNVLIIYNYSNSFFLKYIFHIVILFYFRYKNDFIILFKRAINKFVKRITIVFLCEVARSFFLYKAA